VLRILPKSVFILSSFSLSFSQFWGVGGEELNRLKSQAFRNSILWVIL
jgi:hypothetical protein